MAITPKLVTSYQEAVAFLDARIGLGINPGLERMTAVLDILTNPHEAYPTIHVAGTNGKTTTVRMLDVILTAHDMRTGTYVSPHLQSIEQRYTLAREYLDREQFTQAVADVAPFIEHFESGSETSLTYFEATVAVAFQAFAAAGVDVAVVEVGLGGRWDATNVVNATVSVITGIAMDHMEYLGDSIGAIAGEKAAILKDDGLLISGPLPPAAEGAITAQVAATKSKWLRCGADFSAVDVVKAHGGWSCSIEGMFGTYNEIHLPLHGRHQVDHLATAIVAAEMFFDGPLDDERLAVAIGTLTSPGRLEVIGRRPLILIDGAHNAQGLEGLATALIDEFPESDRTLVIGFRGDRDITSLVEPLQGLFTKVIVTAAADPMAISAADVAAALAPVLGGDITVETIEPVASAAAQAVSAAGENGMVVVTGSLYVVGDARGALLGE